MLEMRGIRLVTAAALVLAPGCGSDRGTDDGDDGLGSAEFTADENDDENDDDDADNGSDNDDGMIKLDVNGGDGNEQGGDEGDGDCEDGGTPPTPNATLTGTVYAPNLEIPISGAVVYLTTSDPDPIPDGVYCAECVELTCGEQFALTEPDGSFSLPAVAGPGQKLVVQKGQFLHITDIEVPEGLTPVPATSSNLPGMWNPAAGMYIPRIAVYDTFNDTIYNLLAKIGLAQVDANGTIVNGTENFDILDSFSDSGMLDDVNEMSQYHIIFIPCMSQSGLGAVSGGRVQNIRDWTEAGGKWYVTDWANEYLYEPFGDYQDFHGGNSPDLGIYESQGQIVDPDLLAWLSALPPGLKDIGGGHPNLNSLPGVTLEDNWSGIDALHDIYATNEEGEQVNVGHHTWVEGPCGACGGGGDRPMTISGGWGCGRMMFSTYHTTEYAHQGLTPQELVLLYIILEIGVCHDAPPPPPPPVE